jgi:hypothetical protein
MNTDIIAKADDLGPTALVAAASALAPDALRNRPQDALMVLMAGRELGFAPMQSLRLITVIKGKITLAADATVALVRKSGRADDADVDHRAGAARGARVWHRLAFLP